MIKKNIPIVNKLGLHARAAMKLVNEAGRYQSTIQIRYNGHDVDAKDILQVMSLGASHGKQVECTISGDDETQAMDAICNLFADRFGESE